MDEELKKLFEEFQAKFEKRIDTLEKNGASEAELKAWRGALEKLKSNSDGIDTLKEEFAKFTKAMDENGKALQDAIDEINANSVAGKSEAAQLNKYIKDNADKIKEMYKARNGDYIEVTIKAPATVTTGNGSLIDNPRALGPLTDVNLRNTDLMQYVSMGETSRGQFSYTESLPKEGDATNVAEGASKPQIDFTWEERYVQPTKVAAWEKITEEASEDVIGLMSVARNFLRKKHDIRVEADVYFGDGVSPNSEGATTLARTFVAGAMALGVTNPNIMDVINAVLVDIYTTHNFTDEAPYMANLAMMNPVDFYLEFVAAKDNEGRPLYPNASFYNRIQIGGMMIIPSERIPAGKLFVADMTRYNVIVRKAYNVRIGWINDDFIKNLFVILGESRYFAYVKELDKIAFVYDDIATIKTAITKV